MLSGVRAETGHRIMNLSNTFRLRGRAAIAMFGFIGLGICVIASAAPSAETRTVRFSDLDLSNPSAVHALYIRIRAAAEVVCSYYFFVTDTDKALCVRDAIADTVTRINRPALSAVYDANNKTSGREYAVR
jgi:UrcA family protein